MLDLYLKSLKPCSTRRVVHSPLANIRHLSLPQLETLLKNMSVTIDRTIQGLGHYQGDKALQQVIALDDLEFARTVVRQVIEMKQGAEPVQVADIRSATSSSPNQPTYKVDN